MDVNALCFSAHTVDKCAAHGTTMAEVEQVARNGPVLVANPRPRVEGSRLMIGPTDGGRLVTVVIDPTLDLTTWEVRTAWPATDAQTAHYRRHRR